jgi:hypothetical protein
MTLKFLPGIFVSCCGLLSGTAAQFSINSFDRQGTFSWTNAFPAGVCTVEKASQAGAPWEPIANFFTTNSIGSARIEVPRTNALYRLLTVDLSTNNPNAFSNFISSFGVIRTIAGNGFGGTDGSNYWRASFEGAPATNAALSRPHFAMADDAGNIFIIDKDSHSLLKVTTDGLIHTVAGTHVEGDGPDGPEYGTNVALRFPNGEWVRRDGTVYILDTDNSKIRRLDTNGILTTLLTAPSGTNGIKGGRGLWVRDDEGLVYFGAGDDIKKWTPGGGFKTLNNNHFNDLGNFVVNPDGDVIATDRGDHKVYLVDATGGKTGDRTRIAGSGATNAPVDGTAVLTNGLYGVRGVWLVPTGGYLLATHEGSQLLYIDAAGILHLLLNSAPGNFHSGDGEWFYDLASFKVTELRSITLDARGNMLIVENDFGYVRMIDFRRLTP